MAQCNNTRPINGCFIPTDGSPSVPIIIHVIYDKDEVAKGQVFTLADDNETPIDITTYLGGGRVVSGCCPQDCDKETVLEFTYQTDLTTPSTPLGTKEIVVFNKSNAWIEIVTSIGSQIVPCNGTIEIELFDCEDPITISGINLVAGTFVVGTDEIGINYKIIT